MARTYEMFEYNNHPVSKRVRNRLTNEWCMYRWFDADDVRQSCLMMRQVEVYSYKEVMEEWRKHVFPHWWVVRVIEAKYVEQACKEANNQMCDPSPGG